MSDKFEQWFNLNFDIIPKQHKGMAELVWNAAISSLQGEQAAKIAELEAKLAQVEKDAELLSWFLETCSEEVALYISGDGQASADELKAAIQESKKGGAV